MKLSCAALFLAASATVASATSIRATAGLLSQSRRLEDANQGDDQAQGDEFSFLAGYSAKLIGCAEGELYKSVNGETEYNSVVFRLCPADSCDSDSATGCKSGYGDYVIGLNSFVAAYIEQNRDTFETDDAMNANEFSECRQYDYQPADDAAEAAAYYVGLACSGTSGVKLELFTDEICTTPAEDVSFSDISGGTALPYSQGNLVSTQCEPCSVTNDNGETATSDLCMNMYSYSGHCETKMDKNSQYSTNDESACEYISSISKSSTGGGAGAAIGWVIFALVSKLYDMEELLVTLG